MESRREDIDGEGDEAGEGGVEGGDKGASTLIVRGREEGDVGGVG